MRHADDAIMPALDAVASVEECAFSIHGAIDIFADPKAERLQLRIGVRAGQSREESNDLVGVTVQAASRTRHDAAGKSYAISDVVRSGVERISKSLTWALAAQRQSPSPFASFRSSGGKPPCGGAFGVRLGSQAGVTLQVEPSICDRPLADRKIRGSM